MIKVWYAEELLFVLLNYLSRKINQLKDIDVDLGALLFSYHASYTGTNKTTIYDSFDIVDDISPFIRALYKFKNSTKKDNAFSILFYSLKKSKFSNDAGDFIFRKRFCQNIIN